MFDAFDDDLDFDDDQFELSLAAVCPPTESVSNVHSASTVPPNPTAPNKLFSDSGIVASVREVNDDSGFFEASSFGAVSKPSQSSSRDSDAASRSPITFEQLHSSSLRSNVNDIGSRERTEFRPRSASPFRSKRLFPGPAGKLTTRSPDLEDSRVVQRPSKRTCWATSMDCRDFHEGNIGTQIANNEIFEDEPWVSMRRDLSEDEGRRGQTGLEILDKYNIAILLQKADKSKLPNRKVPSLLCVILQSIDCGSRKYCRVLLRDPTGQISGWMDRGIMKEFGCKLQPGCVLVLNQPSVVSVAQKKHYLSIHRCNVMKIYLTVDDGSVVRFDPAVETQSQVELGSSKFENWTDGNEDFQDSDRAVDDSAAQNEVSDVPGSAAEETDDDREPRSLRNDLILSRPSNVVCRPRPYFVAPATDCRKIVSAEVSATEPSSSRSEATNDRVQPEQDPLWNDDDFEDLLLSIGH